MYISSAILRRLYKAKVTCLQGRECRGSGTAFSLSPAVSCTDRCTQPLAKCDSGMCPTCSVTEKRKEKSRFIIFHLYQPEFEVIDKPSPLVMAVEPIFCHFRKGKKSSSKQSPVYPPPLHTSNGWPAFSFQESRKTPHSPSINIPCLAYPFADLQTS